MEVYVCDAKELKPGTRFLIKAGQRNIAVYNYKGSLFAIDNACYHHGGPLLQGDIEELGGHPCVICPWHSYRITLDTGEGLYWGLSIPDGGGAPQQQLKSKGQKQRCHTVIVREEKVFCYVDAAGSKLESDMYAEMPIANSDVPTGKAVTGSTGHSSSLHSGMRSGQVFTGQTQPSAPPSSQLVQVRCIKIIQRCVGVASFVFTKVEGSLSKRLDPGMWVTLGLPCGPQGEYEHRTYTVTHLRGDGGWFTITVKLHKESRGGSRWLHEAGDALLTTPLPLIDVGGTFTISKERTKINGRRGLLLMVSAGIGITPLFASLNVFLNDQFTLSAGPPLHILHVHIDHSEKTTPFLEQLSTWHSLMSTNKMERDPVTYRFVPLYTKTGNGRPAESYWQQLLVDHFRTTDVAAMLCGPPTFMNNLQTILTSFGVSPNHIMTELFDG